MSCAFPSAGMCQAAAPNRNKEVLQQRKDTCLEIKCTIDALFSTLYYCVIYYKLEFALLYY